MKGIEARIGAGVGMVTISNAFTRFAPAEVSHVRPVSIRDSRVTLKFRRIGNRLSRKSEILDPGIR